MHMDICTRGVDGHHPRIMRHESERASIRRYVWHNQTLDMDMDMDMDMDVDMDMDMDMRMYAVAGRDMCMHMHAVAGRFARRAAA